MREIKTVVALVLAAIIRPFKRRPLWLVCDRMERAGDNGEAFYLYLRAHHPEIDARFVLARDSADYPRMCALGPIVPWRSLRRKVATLLADRMISSQAERAFVNPFYGYDRLCSRSLARIPFFFLQHGVTKDDISEWFNARLREVAGIVTVSERERQAFLSDAYGFCSSQLLLTGFPRFDRLRNDPKPLIVIMPTWRKYLAQADLETSEFMTFYRSLLNDCRLLAACRAGCWRMVFVAHPNLPKIDADCLGNDVVSVISHCADYSTLLSQGAILVTDYSSVAFDFAYLRKAVVYAQFDREQFFSGQHAYRPGYFDYERDGFGPIVTSVEAVVRVLIGLMNGACRAGAEYERRIEEFFAFSDSDNCDRVFAAVAAQSQI